MRGILNSCIALGAMLTASLASAEVRLVENPSDGTLSVEISSTPRGPWTPTGSVTERVLNPSGDLYGDGMPGWDSRGARVLSAWIRPGTGVLHRSMGAGPGWLPLAFLAAPDAVGQPVVDVLDGGWAIAWQQSSATGLRVLVTGTTPLGEAVDPLTVATGTFVGTMASGNLLHVITLEASNQLWCTTVSFSFVPTQPIPIQLHVVARSPLNGGPVPGRGQVGRMRPQDTILDPRIQDVLKADGSVVSLVTWWTGGALHGVQLAGDDGPRLPGTSLDLRGSTTTEELYESLLLTTTRQ